MPVSRYSRPDAARGRPRLRAAACRCSSRCWVYPHSPYMILVLVILTSAAPGQHITHPRISALTLSVGRLRFRAAPPQPPQRARLLGTARCRSRGCWPVQTGAAVPPVQMLLGPALPAGLCPSCLGARRPELRLPSPCEHDRGRQTKMRADAVAVPPALPVAIAEYMLSLLGGVLLGCVQAAPVRGG